MRLLMLVVSMILILSACGGDSSPTATQPPTVQPTEPPTAQLTPRLAQPTEPPVQATPRQAQDEAAPPAMPTDTPALTQSEPTATLAPTDMPQPTPTTAPADQGRVAFRDALAVADQLVLNAGNLTLPPEGFVYEGWLIADDGTETSTGVFDVGADGSVDYAWTSPSGENLLARYAWFAITIEPLNDSDPHPSSQVPFRGVPSPDALAAARRVFAANDGEPATPRNVSYGQGLLTQNQVAGEHAFNAVNAAAIGAFAEMRAHCEHLINTIEGVGGARYADYNGDGRAENPGDGFGALAYARQIAALLPDASADLGEVEGLLIAIQDKAQQVVEAPDVAAAQPLLDELKSLVEQLTNQAAPAFYAAAQDAASYSFAP
jgi:hypothetical protein